MQNVYAQYAVSNSRLRKFLADFETQDNTDDAVHEEQTDREFESITLKNICFNYRSKESERVFGIGPLNLKIKKGEVVFIIGGNGSGKSTFINILTGLYQASEGEFILNEQEVINDPFVIQRHIAAVFTDNHIFSNNYDNYSLENNGKYKELLEMMEMDKITEDDSEESARKSFSKGQSKRMSLIFALLENKPVIVLDEWAADQDPYFRKYFYEKLLPKLKQDGKTIIAVTHDDAYFKYADRVIKFDYGRIVNDFNTKSDILQAESLWYNEIPA